MPPQTGETKSVYEAQVGPAAANDLPLPRGMSLMLAKSSFG